MKMVDMTGERYGKLVVVERDFSRQNGTYWLCQCDCGNIISVRRNALKRGQSSCGCDFAQKNSLAHTKDEIGKTYGYLTVLGRVPNTGAAARWHCQCKCGNECDVDGVHLRNGSVQSCGCKRYESHNEVEEQAGTRYGKLVVISRAELDKSGKAKWNCKCDCGKICVVAGKNLRSGVTKSCGCLKSKKELLIANLLKENNISFIQQYSFPDLCDKEQLKFDFAILDNDGNLSHLVEYDGEQHFFPIEHFGGQERLDKQRYRDNLKDDYCRRNGIKLIRINYTEEITIEKILGDYKG